MFRERERSCECKVFILLASAVPGKAIMPAPPGLVNGMCAASPDLGRSGHMCGIDKAVNAINLVQATRVRAGECDSTHSLHLPYLPSF